MSTPPCVVTATTLILFCSLARAEKPPQTDNSANKLVFGSNEYDVAEATISGILNSPDWSRFHGQPNTIKWYIEIIGKSSRREHSPLRITFNTLGVRVHQWRAFKGVKREWTNWLNPETGGPYAVVHGENLASPRSGTFEIHGQAGTQFRITSTGVVDNGISYSVDSVFTFTGVTVHGSHGESKNALRRRLEAVLPAHDLSLERVTSNTEQSPPTASAHFIWRPKAGE